MAHSENAPFVYFYPATAKFTSNSAEPDSCFYIAISSNSYIEFLLGDLPNEAGASRVREYAIPAMLSRREHVFGRKSTYSTRAQFLGSKHEIGIECSGGELKVKVDGKVGLVVKRLGWKFRGNERILVGGSDVEFYWDVYNWIVSGGGGGGGGGHGVFVFQVGDVGIWPEIAGLEKRLMRKTMLLSPSLACSPASMVSKSSTLSSSCSSVLQWAEESSDGGRSSCASSRSCGSNGGFSLLLYAWKSD
ncbi:hypothetical protein Scep_030330 [Stephania cephalantha]|uniref:Uncharacterized protein n=1 Tax=Stephania cephalantha TaxID=152367 RepID=A0AAP0E726_9MAGN